MIEVPKGFVPLPEIEQHTDEVSFSHLGLPVGFDDERLGINLRAIERIRRVAGLGDIAVMGYDGETSELTINPLNNQGGVGTAAIAATSRKSHIAQGNIGNSTGTHHVPRFVAIMYSRPDALIKINNAEVTQRIQNDRSFPRGPLDPKAQATYLGKALRTGLSEAIGERLLKIHNVIPSALVASLVLAENIAFGFSFEEAGFNLMLSATLWGLAEGKLVHSKYGLPYKDRLKSVTLNSLVDRYIGAQAIAKSTRFIKPL